MTVHRLQRSQLVRLALPEVFAFFARARNLEALTPPWLRFEVLTPEPIHMRMGTLIHYRLHLHGVPLQWVSQIDAYEQDSTFVDRQLHGPYALWHHRHDFRAQGAGTLISDVVHYSIPLWPLGELAHELIVRRDLEAIFDYRAAAVERHLG
jgi:ligand-binding SRPBCC domain-containing protein